ncbi:MAG: hypothetical protein IPH79_00660 [Sphingomonadales bacterium]|nr:hypothetical protein [Sphingomonadales bacterium]
MALKIIYARVFWVPGKAGAHLAALGSERLETARNEYGRVWTEGFGEPWQMENPADETFRVQMTTTTDVAGVNSRRLRTKSAPDSGMLLSLTGSGMHQWRRNIPKNTILFPMPP